MIGSEAQTHLDDLRRRLYLPDASDADVRRYLEERAAVLQESEAAPPPVEHVGQRRRRVVVPIAALVVLLVAGGALASRAWAPTGTTVRLDVGDGRSVAVRPDAVPTPAPIGVLVDGTAVAGERFDGRGTAVVALPPSDDRVDGGTAMVLLMSPRPARLRWRALRSAARLDGSTFAVAAARGATAPGERMATPTSYIFASGPPDRIVVEAATQQRWTLIVAVTTDTDPVLH